MVTGRSLWPVGGTTNPEKVNCKRSVDSNSVGFGLRHGESRDNQVGLMIDGVTETLAVLTSSEQFVPSVRTTVQRTSSFLKTEIFMIDGPAEDL
jgi:hypothetical protein